MPKPFVHDYPAIRIAGVTFAYPGSEQPVLKEASFIFAAAALRRSSEGTAAANPRYASCSTD